MEIAFAPQVRVGTGIIVVKDGKVLVGRRERHALPACFLSPGGHLDFGETLLDCGHRELEEECGPDFKVSFQFFNKNRLEWFVTNDIMPQYRKHYITIFLAANWVSGEPVNAEPDKCEGWQWVTFDELKKLVEGSESVPLGCRSI
jgi:8-oxo-dGTP diphosphatase